MGADRRQVLASIGVLLTSGCVTINVPGSSDGSGGQTEQGTSEYRTYTDRDNFYSDTETDRPDRDSDGVPDSRDDFPQDPDYQTEVARISETDTVLEGQYLYWELTFSDETEIAIDLIVRDGPSLDVLVFSDSEFNAYENGQRAEYYTDVSGIDTTNLEYDSLTLEAGEYVLVVDNTEWATSPPDNFDEDPARVELEFVAAR